MKSNDFRTSALTAELQQALKDNDADKFAELFNKRIEEIGEEIRADYEEEISSAKSAANSAVLAQRGIRQLTAEEREYYNALSDAMKAKDPKQALSNLDKIFPETIIEAVFEELRTEHPLLSKVNFISSGAAVKMILNKTGYQKAAWGELCDEIVKELTGGFEVVSTNLLKLSAFLPVCKQALDLGVEWLDRYVRAVLYEALANGLEYGIITGSGNDEPIGMDRQVGEDVSVVGGVYPQKEAVEVSALDIQTVGNLISLIAVDPEGKARMVRDLILVVNPADYYGKVIPATTILAPDGSYRSTLPYNIEIIQSPAVEIGSSVFGMAYRYFAAAGSEKDGRITYSDHVHFLEDERVYVIKAFATGMPMDDNAFLLLDISNLAPAAFKVVAVDDRIPSDDATLSSLKIGALTLTPTFDPDEDTYTASTTAATNVITAVPTNAGATITILNGSTVVPNGTAATWVAGTNTVTIAVTAEDGETTETYTVTVTKS